MKKLLILLVFVSVFAQEATHTVKDGDTLWDIAGFYYQNPFLWPYIWRANLTKINDPHWIYPEQMFVIPPSPEEAISEVTEEMPVYVPEEEITMIPEVEPTAEVFSVVKPEERVFSEELIHRAGFIVDTDIPYWGKILGTEPPEGKMIAAYMTIYIDRAQDVEIDDELTIYRPGKIITHPRTGTRLGQEIIVLGKAVIAAIGEEGSRCKVTASYDVIKKGDFVTPYEPVLAPEKVELIPTDKQVEGYVVEVKATEKMIPPHVFAFLDQGEDAGIAVGDVFDVYQVRVVDGLKMPELTIGKIQVVSVFSQASIGLIYASREPVPIKRGERCRLASEAR
ncbi:MAG: LysM peptidoglycan-binding domain-containing protein [candidate division WOR-3 bacterium]|nr:MAG: LysM peptidoglycan-binding domain-containing protein [candidate division WOR-3 bacterium]